MMREDVTLIGPNGFSYATPGFSSNVPAFYDRSSLYGVSGSGVSFEGRLGDSDVSTGTVLLFGGLLILAGGAYWYYEKGGKGKMHARKLRRKTRFRSGR